MSEKLTTRVVTGSEVEEALGFALGDLPALEQAALLEELLVGEQMGRGRILVVEALNSEYGRCGAMAAWLLPGGSATVWPPRVSDTTEKAVKVLAASLKQALRDARVRHAQAILPLDATRGAEILAECGFEWTADLLYLVCQKDAFPTTQPEPRFRLIPNADAQIERLVAVVDATYEETLDCPALNGLRPTREVLDGYKSTGSYRPEWWFLAERDGEPIGCLLLADYPQSAQVELVYFGLIPKVRGRGYGEELVRYAQWVAADAGRERLVLAVDTRNTPAIDAYLHCGFEEWDRRAVWLLRLNGPVGQTCERN